MNGDDPSARSGDARASGRWRGFNFPDLFLEPGDERWPEMRLNRSGRFREEHFAWVAEWGFNYVRLPLAYGRLVRPGRFGELAEERLEPIDEAVRWARKHGLHVTLNLHHAPGYSVNQASQGEAEPVNLWEDAVASEAFAALWRGLAERFRAVPATALSFDLVNEPTVDVAPTSREAIVRALRGTAEAVRGVDAGRPIIVNGILDGRASAPYPEFHDRDWIQSARGYAPMCVTHHGAWWAGYPAGRPEWPTTPENSPVAWDRDSLDALFAPWSEIADRGVTVHCGEMGVGRQTPHEVALRWLEDLLRVLGARGIGWALWNFQGSFGILDSGRQDAAYEDWRGHALDRAMLDLLRRY